MQDRAIRSLVRLQSSGSTSRLLNLLRLHHEHAQAKTHLAQPFFQSPVLNKALLVKHRLRPHEQEMFNVPRPRATKLILAIDAKDLRTGGRFAFVGQRGWTSILAGIVGDEQFLAADRRTLELLDRLPSFDPFLLREQLRRAQMTPASSYFDISPGDAQQMTDYLGGLLQPLVRLTGDVGGIGVQTSTATIVHKLMSPEAEAEFGPLGDTLRLTPEHYAEGMFCWKGFLYYKWRLERHDAALPGLIERMRGARIVGLAEKEERAYIAEAKAKVSAALTASCEAARDLLRVYDDSFELMVTAGDPTAFRDFLMNAPTLFVQLGDLIGVVDHIHDFWNFRFPPEEDATARAEELADILLDFEDCLGETVLSEPPARTEPRAAATALI